MGILTNPSADKRSSMIVERILQYESVVCPFLYLTGLIWFFSLAYAPMNSGTYFSENALLAGLVNNDFTDYNMIKDVQSELKAVAAKAHTAMPHKWIASQFARLGLSVHTQRFSYQEPLTNQTMAGQNVYAVLHAARGSGTEGLVFSAPFTTTSGGGGTNLAGVSVLLSLAHYFRHQTYWAKDLVFLVCDRGHLGAVAWLSAYHHHTLSPYSIHYDRLPERAGNLQAAVNLELSGVGSSVGLSAVDVSMEAVNGQMPNLDLVNLCHWLCRQERLAHTHQTRRDIHGGTAWTNYRWSLGTLLSMMSHQATSRASGLHGFFTWFNIQSVTLRGTPASARSGSVSVWTSLLHLSRVLEGVFRSLNNLEERFHQSFFFYLLPASNRYISIGVYLPSFCLIAGGLLVKALVCWLRFSGGHHISSSSSSVVSATLQSPSCASLTNNEDNNAPGNASLNRLQMLVRSMLITFLFGALSNAFLPVLVRILTARGVPVDSAVYTTWFSIGVVSVLVPCVLKRYGVNGVSGGVVIARCITLLIAGLYIFTTALFNISQALFSAVILTPVVFFISTKFSHRNAVGRLVSYFLLLCVHPQLLQLVLMAAAAHLTGQNSFSGQQLPLTNTLSDSLLYNYHQLPVCVCLHLPVWMQLFYQQMLLSAVDAGARRLKTD